MRTTFKKIKVKTVKDFIKKYPDCSDDGHLVNLGLLANKLKTIYFFYYEKRFIITEKIKNYNPDYKEELIHDFNIITNNF